MFPDRRLRDPRGSAASRNPPRDLGEARHLLSRAASLLSHQAGTSPTTVGPSSSGLQTQRQQPPRLQLSSNRERLNIFRPQPATRQRRSSSAPKPKKMKIWEHTFCCLASKVQDSTPSPMDRGHLLQADWGIKPLVLQKLQMQKTSTTTCLKRFQS